MSLRREHNEKPITLSCTASKSGPDNPTRIAPIPLGIVIGSYQGKQLEIVGRLIFVMRILTDFIFLFLFICLLVAWLIVWAALHLAGGAIHLLLVLAVIFLIVHLFHRRRTA